MSNAFRRRTPKGDTSSDFDEKCSKKAWHWSSVEKGWRAVSVNQRRRRMLGVGRSLPLKISFGPRCSKSTTWNSEIIWIIKGSNGPNMLIWNWWMYSLESSMSTHNAFVCYNMLQCMHMEIIRCTHSPQTHFLSLSLSVNVLQTCHIVSISHQLQSSDYGVCCIEIIQRQKNAALAFQHFQVLWILPKSRFA